jgi:rare lipoprotein A
MKHWRRALSCVCLAALVLSAGACHKKSARVRVPTSGRAAGRGPLPAPPPDAVPGAVEYGYASWYGNPYHGRRTSSGEIYDMYAFTAAHRTLPLGTEVEVVNLENGKKVEVRINDRGPFVDGRIIDLSLSAARTIGVVGPGTALVRLKLLRVPGVTAPPPAGSAAAAAPIAAGRFAAQVGAFSDRRNAERLRDDLARRYPQFVVNAALGGDGQLYRVWVGNEPSQQQASAIVERLRQDGIVAFAVRLD